ncbi:MAG: GGDEF domain protein [Candidatus Scalindua rubra]|uniref:diguanylate cyclase n=1 Tax=Candidatus Scalindua rubra TaxID=1872076 RepID=A0A1E3XFA7_9BACT|nr:MAG: GGDEF domain protein [Candidatus Scalindua rubra]
MILLRGTPVNNTVQIAERLRQCVEAYVFPPFKDSGCVTVSIGGCGLPPDRPIQPLIETADKSLYMAKDNGRNQVKICAEQKKL